VQRLGSGDDIAVQIRKEGTGRAIVGMQQAITVRMQKENNATRVQVGQAKWADKAAVGIIGAIAFWPLMIPAGFGALKQYELPGRVVSVVNTYAATKGGSRPQEISTSMVACPNCGVMDDSEAQYCSACGASLKDVHRA